MLLIWLVWRLGYDWRALVAQTVTVWGVLILTWFVVTDPAGPAGNVNKVFGLVADGEVQQEMSPLAWLGVLLLLHPVLILIPSHFVFRRAFPAAGKLQTGNSDQ